LQQYFKTHWLLRSTANVSGKEKAKQKRTPPDSQRKTHQNVREQNKRSKRPQTCKETTGDGPSGETETPGHPPPCLTRVKACVVLLLTSS
jgi:hypothetical protein